MRCTSSDPCGIHAPAGNLFRAMVVALPRLVIWHRPHLPQLRLLTGTRTQQAAIVLAVRPVVRELVPSLTVEGREIRSIVVLPMLTGDTGDPLQAEIEHHNGTSTYVIRLAHSVGGTLRRPEEVAGALAEELLALYRDAAAVSIVRRTQAVSPAAVSTPAPVARNNGHPAVSFLPRSGVRDDAEGKIVAFKPDPLGTSSNGHAS